MNNKLIPLSVPNLNGNELKYVSSAVETGWVSTGGPYVNEFEYKIADCVKSKGAVSCQNGTSGIHISLILSDVHSYDAVIVPSLTFIAAVNPVKYIGAETIFMDCDDTLCIDPDKLAKYCETQCDFLDGKLISKLSGRHIKALIVVHVFGNMADMERIMSIAEKYNMKVVEDATEAIGTYYTRGKYVGKYAGTIGNIGVYSFNGNKIITTGGGGMIVSNNEGLLQRAKHLTTQAKTDEIYFIHDEIGYNYRMTNLQAAMGLAQLEQLEDFIEIKNKNYQRYKDEIDKIDHLNILPFRDDIRTNRWFYSLYIEAGYRYNRDELIKIFTDNGIQTRPIWGLIHEQIPYQESQAYLPVKSKFYWEHIVNIPCSTNLTDNEIEKVISVLL